MPSYDFKDAETGEVVEVVMPMTKAVPIGQTIEIEDRTLIRLASKGVAFRDKTFTPFVSRQVERHHPAAPRTNDRGNPVFNTKREVDDFCAKTKGSDTGPTVYHWDQ